jgi:hypothetical protein
MGTLPMTQTIKASYCLDRLVNILNQFTVPFPEGTNKGKLFRLIMLISMYIKNTQDTCKSGCDGYMIIDFVTKARWIKRYINDMKNLLLEDEFKTHRDDIQSTMSNMEIDAGALSFEGTEKDLATLTTNDTDQRQQWVNTSKQTLLSISAE